MWRAMARRIMRWCGASGYPNGCATPEIRQETAMKWETPAACDFRFGFEITMYIANR